MFAVSHLRNASIGVYSMLKAVKLPEEQFSLEILEQFPTHQQALPIWTPAWPMWMEMTSLMLKL